MVRQLQVVRHMPKKYLPTNLFEIHMRPYRHVKIWMVKIWQILVGRSSISPNLSGTKVSLHTVYYLLHINSNSTFIYPTL